MKNFFEWAYRLALTILATEPEPLPKSGCSLKNAILQPKSPQNKLIFFTYGY
jgi:hypothetical protein